MAAPGTAASDQAKMEWLGGGFGVEGHLDQRAAVAVPAVGKATVYCADESSETSAPGPSAGNASPAPRPEMRHGPRRTCDATAELSRRKRNQYAQRIQHGRFLPLYEQEPDPNPLPAVPVGSSQVSL